MWNKKVRGQRRKLKTLLRNMEKINADFSFEGEVRGLHVPSSPWIEMPKTYGKIKTEFCRKFIVKTEKIIEQKPSDIGFCKVICAITYPELWNSEIMIFRSEEYFKNFWDRNDSYQTWTKIEGRSFATKRGIKTDLKEVGYIEDLVEEDYTHRSFIWFYGEL